MKTLTLESLQRRTWYRALKIAYLFLFAGALLWAFNLTFIEQPYLEQESYVLCADGTQLDLLENDIRSWDGSLFAEDTERILELCSGTYEFVPVYLERSLSESAFYFAYLAFLIVLGFEVARRSFYYLVLGTVRPKRKKAN